MPDDPDDPDIADILNRARAVAGQPRGDHETALKAPPSASTLAEARFRAECDQRPVMTVVAGYPVAVFPIGMRPAPR